MRLHEAGTDESTLHISHFALRVQSRFNGSDPATLDANIEQGLTRTRGKPGVPENEIHSILLAHVVLFYHHCAFSGLQSLPLRYDGKALFGQDAAAKRVL